MVADDTRVVVIDAETSPFIDVIAVQMLIQLRNQLAQRNIHLRVARDVAQFGDVVAAVDASGELRVFPTVAQALAE